MDSGYLFKGEQPRDPVSLPIWIFFFYLHLVSFFTSGYCLNFGTKGCLVMVGEGLRFGLKCAN